jgi:hypothetical protein
MVHPKQSLMTSVDIKRVDAATIRAGIPFGVLILRCLRLPDISNLMVLEQ